MWTTILPQQSVFGSSFVLGVNPAGTVQKAMNHASIHTMKYCLYAGQHIWMMHVGAHVIYSKSFGGKTPELHI